MQVIKAFIAANETHIKASYSFLGFSFISCQWRLCLPMAHGVILDFKNIRSWKPSLDTDTDFTEYSELEGIHMDKLKSSS